MTKKNVGWDDSHMKKTIACTVITGDGQRHSVNVSGNHPSPVSQAMAYVCARYRKQGRGNPRIQNAY